MRGHETQEIVVGMLEQVGTGNQEMEKWNNSTRKTTKRSTCLFFLESKKG